MNKYERVKTELEEEGVSRMKCFGNSMTPILESGSLLEFEKQEEYEVDDIVFCKVKGRHIDAHKITKKEQNKKRVRYMIANNKGYENGWTQTIYGKVVAVIKEEKQKQINKNNMENLDFK